MSQSLESHAKDCEEILAHIDSIFQALAQRDREALARTHLPVSLYTQWYWKINLHNLLHFLELRMDTHAQYEIRVYAHAMAQIVKDVVPWTWEAFEEFRLNALTFSASEKAVLAMLLQGKAVELPDSLQKGGRRREFEEKLVALGVDPAKVLPPPG